MGRREAAGGCVIGSMWGLPLSFRSKLYAGGMRHSDGLPEQRAPSQSDGAGHRPWLRRCRQVVVVRSRCRAHSVQDTRGHVGTLAGGRAVREVAATSVVCHGRLLGLLSNGAVSRRTHSTPTSIAPPCAEIIAKTLLVTIRYANVD